ncbi:MAG: DUF3078 domain-containing protein [Bacteroidales bacterium]|nr:DUF3078 domain-containing protein [Bacteroidales bacterium]
MKKPLFILVIALFTASFNYAQVTDAEAALKNVKEELPDGWQKGGLFSVGFNQVSLTNWAAGGQNSLSGNSLFNLFADYKKESLIWNTSLDLGYGLMKQGKDQVIKTDDKIDLLSKVGLKATEHWFYAGLLNFKTQMTPGYNYPNDSVIISKFLAPGYLLGALGMDYVPNENFTMFLAPLTGKITFVNDQALADLGSFGVDPGKKSRTEFGGYIRALYKRDITENITFQTKADFFSNYLDEPQNIDVNWETLLLVKAGRFITISFATHLIYDADILFNVNEDGTGGESKVQFKQLLGVGLSYKF